MSRNVQGHKFTRSGVCEMCGIDESGSEASRRCRRAVRLSQDELWLSVACSFAERSSCARRAVGCVFVAAGNVLLAAGYNGPARGRPHCTTTPCPGANAPSGQALELCEAIHAEENALLRCSDVERIETVYSTASPCLHCVRRLLNTGARRIVFLDEYPHPEARRLWLASGRAWQHWRTSI